ncbi:MAG: metallophosphoesterase [Bacteroidetes bacterium]|nr:metallophosphoesterase [Bacteroidota bacterium]
MKLLPAQLLVILITVNTFPSWSQVGQQGIKICVISDVHYFDTSLLINDGTAFQNYLTYDRKLLKESYAITESLIDSLIAEQPDIVLVSGDITKDGELICHQKMAAYFEALEMNGAQVFVSPGNHDINNPHAVAYDGDVTYPVPSVNAAEFVSTYEDFGFNEAILRDTASLSYVAEPIPGLQILSMDVCRYDSNYINNYPQTDGGFKPQVLEWVKDRVIDATSSGKIILGLQHHNMIEHFTNQKLVFSEYVIDDWDNISTILADLGLKVVFTGHFHAQDAVSKTTLAGNTIFDFETGSAVTFPCPYRIVTIHPDLTMDVTGKRVTEIDYDTGSMTFQQYAKNELVNGLPSTIIYLLTNPPFNLSQSTAEFVEPAFSETILAHYEGNEGSPSSNTQFVMFSLYLSGYGYIADGMQSIWNDKSPDDWNMSTSLQPALVPQQLNITILLQGPFSDSEMTTHLNPEFLPLAQPYIDLPWNYSGLSSVQQIPSPDVVDWVLVETHDAPDAASVSVNSLVGRRVGWLHNNGNITALNGSSNLQFYHEIKQALFVVVRHRNHLAVLSSSPLVLSGGIYTYDYTTDADKAFGGIAAQAEVIPGKWALIAGDADADGVISQMDKTDFWSVFSGKSGYLKEDFNLDSQVDNLDKNDCWRINLGENSQLPAGK